MLKGINTSWRKDIDENKSRINRRTGQRIRTKRVSWQKPKATEVLGIQTAEAIRVKGTAAYLVRTEV